MAAPVENRIEDDPQIGQEPCDRPVSSEHARRVARDERIECERVENAQKMAVIRATRNKRILCVAIQAHHDVLNDDPDRFSSEFLIRMIKGDAAVVPSADRIRVEDHCSKRDLKARGWTVTGIKRFLDDRDLGVFDLTFVAGQGRWLYPTVTVEEIEQSGAYRAFMVGYAARSDVARARWVARKAKTSCYGSS